MIERQRGHRYFGSIELRDYARHFGGKAPKAPAPPPAPPKEDDPEIKDAERKADLAARNRKGRTSLITNEGGAMGDTSQAPVYQKTLLGQ